MKTRLRKFGPPVAVIGAALYLGWPPSAPMDLGDDIVRAKSVRWKVTELDPPNLTIHTAPDPFAAVLVDATSNQPVMPQGKPQQVRNESWGPTENDLRKGLSLSGIARTDSYRWAVVNRRVCRPGDTVPVIGLVDVEATIEQIHHDKITVAVDALIVDIRPDQHKSSSATTP